jgi:toxin ParE1/3/4
MLIRWTKPAADDLTHICDYTEEHFGPQQARRAAVGIFDSVESLKALPNRGRPGRKLNTHEMSVSGLPFVIIYRVGENVVEIIRILHFAQKWP